MMKLKYAAVAVFLASAQMSSAAVIGGDVTSSSANGTFQQMTNVSGMTIGRNNHQSDHLHAFNERQNVRLGSNLKTDTGRTISAGTHVSSHYVFFDPFRGRQSGFVEFSGRILGIMTSWGGLMGTDKALGLDDVTYLFPRLRGLERRDTAEIDAENENRMLVNWRASSPGDYVRVITEGDKDYGDVSAVPLPASGFLLLGALGFMAARRRR